MQENTIGGGRSVCVRREVESKRGDGWVEKVEKLVYFLNDKFIAIRGLVKIDLSLRDEIAYYWATAGAPYEWFKIAFFYVIGQN